jgi:hypothetical protein
LEAERLQWEKELVRVREQADKTPTSTAAGPKPNHEESPKNDRPKSESSTHPNPVLGSLIEQFGKLRQQRAMSRPVQPKQQ